MSILISTLSPIRSPLSVTSEYMAYSQQTHDLTFPLQGKNWDHLFVKDGIFVRELNWDNGYGTIDNDILPPFFQPLFKRCFEKLLRQICPCELDQLTKQFGFSLSRAELYIFDDTIALMRIDFSFDKPDDTCLMAQILSDMDLALSQFAKDAYCKVIFDLFRENIDSIVKINNTAVRFTNPNKFPIFSDLNFSKMTVPSDELVLWTGRTLIVNEQNLSSQERRSLLDWAKCDEDNLQTFAQHAVYIGSGNALTFSNDSASICHHLLRALTVCQFYYAVQHTFGGILKSTLLDLSRLEDKSNISRATTLLHKMTKRLDHLDFIQLEFEDVKRGMQAERAFFLQHAITNWRIEELEQNALKRASLIRSRVERVKEKHQTKISRSIEMILAAIGGISIIDFVLSLSSNAENIRNDNIPGMIDFFGWLQPDITLWIASFIVIAIAFIVYHGKR